VVIPAKPVPDHDRGAGTWIADKPCGLSGMTTEGYPAVYGGWLILIFVLSEIVLMLQTRSIGILSQ